jgi:hypothetical protein
VSQPSARVRADGRLRESRLVATASKPHVLAIGITVIAVLPLVVAALTHVGGSVVPIGDFAIIDWRVRDVFTSSTPLVGAYSRFGWSHPGPVMYWALAPFSLLAGGAAWGMYVGSALIQAVGVAWSARIAWRRGGLLLTLSVLLIQLLVYVGLRSALPWFRPWNPSIALPFLMVFLLATWSIGLGDRDLLPVAAAAGSLLVLTHVGYAPLVVVGVTWIGLAFRRQHATRDRTPGWVRARRWTAIVLAVLWAPALLEQILHGIRGNLGEVAVSAFGGRVAGSAQLSFQPLGFGRGLGVFLAEFHVVPPWLGGDTMVSGGGSLAEPVSFWYACVPLVLIALGLIVARRSRARAEFHAVALAAVLGLVGVLALARVRGEPADYVFYWRVVLAVLIVATALGALVRSAPAMRRRTPQLVLGVLLSISILGTSGWLTTQVLRGDDAADRVGTSVSSLLAQIEREAPRAGPVAVLQTNDRGLFTGVPIGVFNELDRAGYSVGLSLRFSKVYLDGEHRRQPGGRTWFIAEGLVASRLAAVPGAKVLATASPLSTSEELRLRSLQLDAFDQLTAADRGDLTGRLDSSYLVKLANVPGVDRLALTELAKLNAKVQQARHYRFAVVELQPDDLPDGVEFW